LRQILGCLEQVIECLEQITLCLWQVFKCPAQIRPAKITAKAFFHFSLTTFLRRQFGLFSGGFPFDKPEQNLSTNPKNRTDNWPRRNSVLETRLDPPLFPDRSAPVCGLPLKSPAAMREKIFGGVPAFFWANKNARPHPVRWDV